MAVLESGSLKPLPGGEINPYYYKEMDNFILTGGLRGKQNSNKLYIYGG